MHSRSIKELTSFLQDIKVSHTLFSLPYVVISFFSLAEPHQIDVLLLVKIILALCCARTFAMGANRILDRTFDALNPRTENRGIPAGKYSARSGKTFVTLAGLGFCLLAYSIAPLCGYLSPLVLAVLAIYSLMKRWIWLTHFYLGMCLGLSVLAVPVCFGYWPDSRHYALFSAVVFWTAGFDMIYALQDMSFDRKEGLYSFPARFGHKATYITVILCFTLMECSLSLFAREDATASTLFSVATASVGLLLAAEVALVRSVWSTGTSRWIQFSFFNINAFVGVFLACVYLVERFTQTT